MTILFKWNKNGESHTIHTKVAGTLFAIVQCISHKHTPFYALVFFSFASFFIAQFCAVAVDHSLANASRFSLRKNETEDDVWVINWFDLQWKWQIVIYWFKMSPHHTRTTRARSTTHASLCALVCVWRPVDVLATDGTDGRTGAPNCVVMVGNVQRYAASMLRSYCVRRAREVWMGC